MSAIGPGDWVQKVNGGAHPDDSMPTTVGAIYQVERLLPETNYCGACGDITRGFLLIGRPHGRCINHYRPWPGPADESLRSEAADHDEQVPA